MSLHVTVSRLWHNPTIYTVVSEDGIAITCTLADFVAALKNEMGSVALTFTRAGLSSQMDAAVDRVLSGIKAESVKAL